VSDQILGAIESRPSPEYDNLTHPALLSWQPCGSVLPMPAPRPLLGAQDLPSTVGPSGTPSWTGLVNNLQRVLLQERPGSPRSGKGYSHLVCKSPTGAHCFPPLSEAARATHGDWVVLLVLDSPQASSLVSAGRLVSEIFPLLLSLATAFLALVDFDSHSCPLRFFSASLETASTSYLRRWFTALFPCCLCSLCHVILTVWPGRRVHQSFGGHVGESEKC
jgi:hypothetical protein